MVVEYSRGLKEKLTRNFQKNEFDCHCGGKYCNKTVHDTELSEKLQIVRDYFGKPVHITSPYRCPSHNANVGGGSQSYHMNGGKAADFVIYGVNVKEIAKVCEAVGFNGIGCYLDDGFVHADVRPISEKFFWYGHEEIPTETFGGADIDIYIDSIDVGINPINLAEDIKQVLRKYNLL